MTESELLRLLSNPNSKTRGFTYLFDLYKQRLYHHIHSITHNHQYTDDVLQNTFIKVYQHIDHFEGKSSLYTWLYRIASNEALSFLKKEAKHQQISIDELRLSTLNKHQTTDDLDIPKIEKKLSKALVQLPHRQAMVFSMHHDQHLKLKEIAVILETSLGNVKSLHHLAQKKIKTILKQD